MRPPVISAPSQSETFPFTSMTPPFMDAPRCIPTLPVMVTRPRVMPRAIHLTLLRSPRIETSSLASPSTPKNSSSRRRRLPRCTGKARRASRLSPAITSGETLSASRGTLGCSFKVSVSMPKPFARDSGGGPARGELHAVHALGLDRVVVERHRVELLEYGTQVVLDPGVVGRLDHELPALHDLPDLSLLDDDLAALDDVAWRPEESLAAPAGRV